MNFPGDARAIRRSFDRAGASYDAAAVLQKEVRENLLGRLALTKLQPKLVLDAGAGTGHAAKALLKRYPGARLIALDGAIGMLQAARGQLGWWRKFDRVCADAAHLPLPDSSVDLIFSNLMLQWCDPDLVLAEFRRVLAPHGLLALTSFGPDTLKELRAAWQQADAQHEHVMAFIDMHDLGDALARAGFAAPVLDTDLYTLSYQTVRDLMTDLKAIGARNAHPARARGLTGRKQFAVMQSAYETFRTGQRLPATYEVVYANAWAPAPPADTNSGDETHVSLSEIKAQLARAARHPGQDPERP
jgi:malonyl-CoA O-methyltransferase